MWIDLLTGDRIDLDLLRVRQAGEAMSDERGVSDERADQRESERGLLAARGCCC
jgi:hypothetical protein